MSKGKGNSGGGGGGDGGGGGGWQQAPRKAPFYTEHITRAEADRGLAGGTLLQGKLRVNSMRRKSAYVSCAGVRIDILIDDEQARNRAVHGDLVAIEMLPETEWESLAMTAFADPGADEVFAGGGGKRGNGQGKQKEEEEEEEDEEGDRDHAAVQERLWRPRRDLLQLLDSESEDAAATEVDGDGGEATAAAEGGEEVVEAPRPFHPIDDSSWRAGLQPRGKVVCILSSCHQQLHTGSLQLMKQDHNIAKGKPLPSSEIGAYFKMSDPRYPDLFVPRINLPEAFVQDPRACSSTIFLANISPEWPTKSKMALAENVRSLGEMGSIETETEALLIQASCLHGPFTQEALESLRGLLGDLLDEDAEEAAAAGGSGRSKRVWQVPAEEIAKRRDLRATRIFTIDPPNAKDLDDALHITELEDGTYEIGVHIADVSYFLAEGTPLDVEAQKRATSVYLVQKVIPMLPPILCEQLCSLNPNVDRLTYSCIWRMNKDGSLVEGYAPWFGRTVIRSCAKLDYPTAQRMVDGLVPKVPSEGSDPDAFLASLPEAVWEGARRPPPPPEAGALYHQAAWAISQDVCLLHAVAMERRKRRLRSGALTLHRAKMTFSLNMEGNPVRASTYVLRESNQLVEEYMLLANYLVAEELLASVGKLAFLRGHPTPDKSKFTALTTFAESQGLVIDVSTARSLQLSLAEIQRTADPLIFKCVTALLMLPMKEAFYMVAGQQKSGRVDHYALSISYYTHFTSPIRRYADVTVHRLLTMIDEAKAAAAAVGGNAAGSVAWSAEKELELGAIATHCNDMKTASKNAQTRSDRVFLSVYLMDHPCDVSGVVIGIGPKSFTVLIECIGEQERIFCDDLERDAGVTNTYDAATQTITLVRGAKKASSSGGGGGGGGVEDAAQNGTAGGPGSSSSSSRILEGAEVMQIRYMCPVVVHLSSKRTPPLNVTVTLLGPGAVDDSQALAGGLAGILEQSYEASRGGLTPSG